MMNRVVCCSWQWWPERWTGWS